MTTPSTLARALKEVLSIPEARTRPVDDVVKAVVTRVWPHGEPVHYSRLEFEGALDRREEREKVVAEMARLFDLIVAEFETDPQSVACFDLRVVERAKYVNALFKSLGEHEGS